MTLESLDLLPLAAQETWRELGRELARLHEVVANTANRSLPPPGPLPDPRQLVEAHAAAGWFTTTQSRWLRQIDEDANLETRIAGDPPTPWREVGPTS